MRRSQHIDRVSVVEDDGVHEGLDGVLAVPAVDLELVVGGGLLVGAEELLVGGEVVGLAGIQGQLHPVNLDLVLGVGEGLQAQLMTSQVDLVQTEGLTNR